MPDGIAGVIEESPAEMLERSYRAELPDELYLTAPEKMTPEAVYQVNRRHWLLTVACIACPAIGAIVGGVVTQ